MRKIQAAGIVASVLLSMGFAQSLRAESPLVLEADAVFRSQSDSLIRQINAKCGDEGCATDPCVPEDAGDGCGLNGGCSLGEGFDLGTMVFGEESSIDIGGWIQSGYHTRSDGVFNTLPHRLQTQQANIYAEKIADGSEGLDFGFRGDLMYGTDAQNTQSFGNSPGEWDFQNGFDHGSYGWAIPQAYGEVAMGDLSIKVGHFYTLLGYQVVPATGNFFYSIPYTFNFSEAFTHTGALATYKASDDVTIYGGWTLGWDTGFDRLNDGSNFLGGASVKVTDDVTVTYITTIGNLGWIGEGYAHSVVADWVINDKWESVTQSDYVAVDLPNGAPGEYETIGVNQYLFYTINDMLKAGGRAEWWKVDGLNLYEFAFGVNVSPMSNLRIRPEVRYNYSNDLTAAGFTSAIGSAFDRDTFGNQLIFAVDAVVTF